MNARLQEALRLAELGYSVLPIQPGSKAPLCEHGAHDATTAAKIIEGWWRRWPQANLGIATPGLVVVDVDGQDNHWPGDPELATDLQGVPTARTPRGQHFYFRRNDSLWRSSASRLAPDVDVKAGPGSYLVAATSAIKGARYEWLVPLECEIGQLPEPPAWLVEKLDALEHGKIGAAGSTVSPNAGSGGPETPSRNGTGTGDPTGSGGDGSRPGDEYNISGDARAVLIKHGWTLFKPGENEHWCRPGKTGSTSATLKDGVFFNFSGKAAPFDADRGYSPFAVFALLEHNGDFSAAAMALATADHGADISGIVGGGAPEPVVPFPTDQLPEAIAKYVREAAKSVTVDECAIGAPILAALAGTIAATRRIQIKPGDWYEPAVLWIVLVAQSGEGKSPAVDKAMRFVREIEQAGLDRWQADVERHERGELDDEPAHPRRRMTSDVTTEAIIGMIARNKRGMLVESDELDGWLGGFDSYRGNGSKKDRAAWLHFHGARTHTVDRKTSMTEYAKWCAVSVCGGIQPAVLAARLTLADRAAGLLARMLVVSMPTRYRPWTDATVSAESIDAMRSMFNRLDALTFGGAPESPEPVDLPMSKSAQQAFIEWHDGIQRRIDDIDDGDEKATLAKALSHCARIALILELAEWGSEGSSDDSTFAQAVDMGPDHVSGQSVRRAIRLTDWFVYSCLRVYATLDEEHKASGQGARLGKLKGIVERLTKDPLRGITMAELRRGSRRFTTTDEAQVALDELVKAGLGDWHDSGGGKPGQPTRYFRLRGDDSASVSTAPSGASATGGSM